jgi:hypothetical protein
MNILKIADLNIKKDQKSSNVFSIVFGSMDEYVYSELVKKNLNEIQTLTRYVKLWTPIYHDVVKVATDI